MDKLSIKAPVNSLTSAKMQIKSGANEIYLSYISDKIKNLSFSGRGKTSINKVQTQMNYTDFCKIIELAHHNNVKVELAANVPMSGDSPGGGHEFQNEYIEYIREAITAGIDGIIVGDLGNLILLNKVDISTHITASTFFGVQNLFHVLQLEKLNVDKVCLPHHFTFEEMKAICDKTSMDIEVFAHFGCSFIESTCSLYHHASEKIDFGVPCRANFKIDGDDTCENILDMGEDCALCKLPEIIESGVKSIKMIGRELDYKLSSTITYVYSYAIQELTKGKNIHFILNELKNKIDFSFWDKSFCSIKRCKYNDFSYYI